MDKLKRVLSGNDETSNDENRGIMGDVGVYTIIHIFKHLVLSVISADDVR